MLINLIKKCFLLSLIAGFPLTTIAQNQTRARDSKGYPAHDPVMIKQDHGSSKLIVKEGTHIKTYKTKYESKTGYFLSGSACCVVHCL
jgi:hypothetical protein